MRICCLSDLHGYLPEVPNCDLLLLAGDYCRYHNDQNWYFTHFENWLRKLRQRMQIIAVAGNHDFLFERHPELAAQLPWVYLVDDGTEVGEAELSTWGAPWQPIFYNWAFNLSEEELEKKWALIPDHTDILLLHGPPHGYGDAVTELGAVRHCGSKSLLRRIEQVQPKLVVCGHIHGGYGVYQIGKTVLVNASHCDEQYRPGNKPIVMELEETETKWGTRYTVTQTGAA